MKHPNLTTNIYTYLKSAGDLGLGHSLLCLPGCVLSVDGYATAVCASEDEVAIGFPVIQSRGVPLV
jgi:hypothetical protein